VVQQKDESLALRAVALMEQGKVVELDTSIALRAPKLSLELKLPMADSLMLTQPMRLGRCSGHKILILKIWKE
jgi:hypothetical protein